MTSARLVVGSAAALLLTALLGFQAGISVPPRKGTYASLLLRGRGWCELGSLPVGRLA